MDLMSFRTLGRSGLVVSLSLCEGHDKEGAALKERMFLTAKEVSERCCGEINVGALRKWRAMRVEPGFAKIGKAVLTPDQRARRLEREDSRGLPYFKASHFERAGSGVMITEKHDMPIPIAAPYRQVILILSVSQ